MRAYECVVGAEEAREVNAVYGLIAYARARCYPPALMAHLEALLQMVQTQSRSYGVNDSLPE